MRARLTRLTLIIATLASAVVFLGMTVDSIRQVPARTHSDRLSPDAVEGKRIWQQYDCNDCHTILGIGGYYAPDVTKSYATRGEAWLKTFLKDPSRMYPSGRQMPNFHLSEGQINDLVFWLKWVSEIDTNQWPPAPPGLARRESPGRAIFLAQHCNSCHTVDGIGGQIGPDLSHVGSRRSVEWIADQIDDPRRHNQDSIMPGFATLPATEKQELARYLAGLK